MEAKIELIDSNEIELTDLNNWISEERLEGINTKINSTPDENSMGGVSSVILLYYLSIPVLKEALKVISTWFSERQPSAKVKFEDKKSGRVIEITAKNIKNIDKLIESISSEL